MATLYFNNAIDGDWQTLGNWWTDPSCVTPYEAVSLPSSSDNIHIIGNMDGESGVLVNSGSVPTVNNVLVYGPGPNVYISIELTVTGLATFDGGNAYLYTDSPENEYAIINGNCQFINGASIYQSNNVDDAVVNGNATFYHDSYNHGTVVQTAIFYNSSYNDYGIINGNAIFYGSSYHRGDGLIGDAVFNDYSYQDTNSTVGGNAIFNDHASNNGSIDQDAIFNNDAFNNSNGAVYGNGTFYNNSYNSIDAYINQNAIFNGNSYNDGGSIGISENDPPNTHYFNNSSYNAGVIYGNSYFNDSSFAYPTTFGAFYENNPVFQNRTPYPLKRGVNGSNLLGII
jgi:hypothetical protein